MSHALEGRILHRQINGPAFWRNEFFLVVSVEGESVTLLPLSVEARGDNHDGVEQPIIRSVDSGPDRVNGRISNRDEGDFAVVAPDGMELSVWDGEPKTYHFA